MEALSLIILFSALLGLVLLLELLAAVRRQERPVAFARREPFLDADRRRCLAIVREAAGAGRLVMCQVPAAAVLQPAPGQSARRRARGAAQLQPLVLDFLVCAAADAHPLCALVIAEDRGSRARRQSLAYLSELCAAAGLPLIPLPAQGEGDPEAVRRHIAEVVDSADMLTFRPDEPAREDEEAVLEALSASLQDTAVK
ncbi:DUF2726 domain-containing protein [Thiohalocapsa marina]|uniref:DUF2726 domain-containing protein n=1 Tax=Thiohalocapsa marina TaxID=424902 RepID=UPI0014781719|nr:DUF2726 domain-containing protein [Thiohalocapsa marina]